MNNQKREEALNLINRIRSRVALGEFQAQNFLSSASGMNKLSWSCGLERMAQRAVRRCPPNPPPPMPNAINFHFFNQGTSPSILKHPLEMGILEWAEISTVIWPADNIFDGNPALRYFANLIFSTTNSVGCSETVCGNRASVACVFSQPDVRPGTAVYTSGNSCQTDAECNNFSPSFCEFGLCVNAVRPSTTATLPITTTKTTTTTKTARRSTDCSGTEFSADYRETALGAHNNFRSLVATGRARNAEHVNENAPPSSRMDLLVYDCNAERFAHNHVILCDRQMSPAASRPGYEENIHILGTIHTDHLGAIQNAILTWSNELTQGGIPSNMIFTSDLLQRRQRTVTRVSKVIWGTNRKVGCASHACSGFYFTSCMYSAPVNVVGRNIYDIGAVCSGCPAGPNNCDGAVGLCSS